MNLIEPYQESNYGIRPTEITTLSILIMIGSISGLFLNSFPSPIQEEWMERASWYSSYLYVLYPASLVCSIGIWKMKRWAFIAYGSITLLTQFVLLSIERWKPTSLIFVAVVILILARYLSRANRQNTSEQDS